MNALTLIWGSITGLLGKRLAIELCVLVGVLLFYEGIPGIAWIGSKVPVVGAYMYLVEGRVPRSYYAGVKDEAARWEAARIKWEDAKRTEISGISKDYALAMTQLRADNIKLTSVLDETQKDLENEQQKPSTDSTGKSYCPPAVPSRLRNYLDAIR